MGVRLCSIGETWLKLLFPLVTFNWVLLVNVYMPVDKGDVDSYTEYVDICTKIAVLYNDTDTSHLLMLGDFNCSAE